MLPACRGASARIFPTTGAIVAPSGLCTLVATTPTRGRDAISGETALVDGVGRGAISGETALVDGVRRGAISGEAVLVGGVGRGAKDARPATRTWTAEG
mmetsp:Transcript_28690/g.78904  ORF Transcript_28690/g.78904 Transcript_28690/m.78904 type:complete len:99 (-) Transcript_28690:1412-1708(-)